MKKFVTLALLFFALPTSAAVIEVSITGDIAFNQIGTGDLSAANSGDAVVMSFRLDSNNFVDSVNFPVRGYVIDSSSFSFTAGSASVGMADPLPAGTTPYFVVRESDPVVDGFFVGTNLDGFPNGVPSDSAGAFGPFMPNFSVSYSGDTLTTLSILDALGVYDFAGLMSFGFTVDDGPFAAMEVNFSQMSIQAVPLPAGLWLLLSGLAGLAALRRTV